MSYTTIKNKNIKDKSVSIVTNPTPTDFVDDWVRNPSWLPLPAVTDNMMVALYGVFPNSNYMAISTRLSITTHNYVVDWGDGVVETFLSDTNAYHTYDYNTFDVSNSTLVTDDINGTYKQAIITITPEIPTTSILGINGYITHNVGRLPSGYSTNLLDISVTASLATSMIFGNVSGAVTHRKLEKVTIGANSLYAITGAYAYCSSLRSVTMATSSYSSAISLGFLFYSCKSLKTGLNYSGNVSITQSMYDGCSALQYVPPLTITGAGSAGSMFRNCNALKFAPMLNLSLCTTTSSMFDGCTLLKNIPSYNTPLVTDFSNMFQNCANLENAPFLNTSAGTSFANMFNSCSELKSVPHYNTGNATNTAAMFSGCWLLENAPLFDLSKCTTTQSMFRYCYTLTTVPKFNLSKVTQALYMFSDCYNIQAVPDFDLSLVQDASYMYQNTLSLTSIPPVNLPAAVNTMSMFFNSSLATFPVLNVPNTTTSDSMFSRCKFTEVPDISLPKTTSCQNMFNNCQQLVSIGNMTTGPCINYANMFANCLSLIKVGTISTTATSSNSTGMFTNCQSLKQIKNTFPATCRIVQAGSFASSCASLESIEMNNTLPWQNTSAINLPTSLSSLKALISSSSSFSINSTKMDRPAVEDFLQNYLSLPITSVTVTNTPANIPPLSFTLRSTTAGNATIPFTSTTGIVAGMQVTGTGTSLTTPISVSYTTGTNVFTLAGFTFATDEMVSFTTAFGSILANTYYYVVNPSGNTFQVASTIGGSPVSVGASSSTALMRFFSFVQSFVPNTSVTLTKPCTSTATSTLSFQVLKTGYALLKGASVTQ